MSRGKLCCCGSPIYLKAKYGSGYNLVLTRKQTENTVVSPSIGFYKSDDQASTNKITEFVQKYINTARLNTSINSEVTYVLPKDMCDRFAQLFVDLEANKDSLNIINIGISVTTVEEVFLKIGELENCDDLNESNVHFMNKPPIAKPSRSIASSTVNIVNNEDGLSDDEDVETSGSHLKTVFPMHPGALNFYYFQGLWTGSVEEDRTDTIPTSHLRLSESLFNIFPYLAITITNLLFRNI
jgi:hypothetical protein